MSMILAYHGGFCCGIKVIHGMTYSPTAPGGEEKLDGHKDKDDYDLRFVLPETPRFNIYWEKAPAETGVERLDRYLEYLKVWRPKHLVEIVLNQYQDVWVKYLEERGFKATTTFKNSNTGSKVTVYHLVLNEDVTYGDYDDCCDCDDCVAERESFVEWDCPELTGDGS